MPAAGAALSVVIPAYNCGAYLPSAVRSVMAQRDCDLQVIVVDDGSTDETQAIVESLIGVIYVRQPRAGAAAARNTGVSVATGTLLAFLDADDCWAPSKLARQRQHLDDHGTDMVFGHAVEYDSAQMPAFGETPPPGPAIPARCAGTMLIARERFDRVGPFDTGWRVGEFIDWYLRATDLGLTAGLLPDVVLHRRLHPENSGRRAGQSREDYLRIIKLALDRRRATDGTAGARTL